ncbi:TPA: hypothetical protein DEO28_01020 [Candidatus Dependentiae bacterium]|nr:MAG: hypothetical protein UR14_C0003G0056 [candidate division TM6 bacterium GW2011_GWE2_31_21]KKP53780.1 MAG: hypothetical protein UR43_C0003G0101 [candidate division TM6 bacterium GW2011_GWF2_33_332]HBS48466.1 hypothetical protein [Candidatus Dependentiae bacterium]HBZ73081.1 hypothetical protein [Candidatus Dependentiae bacterium]
MTRRLSILSIVLFLMFSLLKADLVIDNNFQEYDMIANGSVTVPEGQVATFRNVIVDSLSSTRLVVSHPTSQVIWENATITLDGDYTFTSGSLIIKGDCEIKASAETSGLRNFTFQGHNILIDDDATLKVNGVTFVAKPTMGNVNLFVFSNSASTLLLDNGTLKVDYLLTSSNHPIFVNGRFIIDGNSTVDNTSSSTMYSLQLGNGAYQLADCKLQILPGAKLNVKNAGIIFKNLGENSFDFSGGRGTLDIDSATNGKFLFVPNITWQGGLSYFDFSTLNGYSPVITGTISGVTQQFAGLGSTVAHISESISPNGRFVASGVYSGAPTSDYKFWIHGLDTGLTSTQLEEVANTCYLEWSPTGSWISFIRSGAAIRVYPVNHTDGGIYGPAISIANNGTGYPAWSLDGRFLAVGVQNNLNVYKFDGSNLTLFSTVVSGTSGAEDNVFHVSWSPNGKYLAAGLANSNYDGTTNPYEMLKVYRLDGTNLTLIASLNFGSLLPAYNSSGGVHWSPDGIYLASNLFAAPALATDYTKIYKMSGEAFTEKSSLDTTPAYRSWKNDFSKDWSLYFEVIDAGGFNVYKTQNAEAVLNTTPVHQATGLGDGTLAVSPNAYKLALGDEAAITGGNLAIYNINSLTSDPKVMLYNSNIYLQQDLTLNNIRLGTTPTTWVAPV